MYDKKYNILDPILQTILRECITLTDEDKKIYNDKLHYVLENVINKMKEVDCLFQCLYQEKMYTGSYYENLRINKPDEFDINLIISLPINFEVNYTSAVPGFVQLIFKSFKEDTIKKLVTKSPDIKRVLQSWISNEQYLCRTNFKQWMQGVFDKALQGLKLPDIEVKRSSSGPAFTLKIIDPPFAVDLVPVLKFTVKDWPSSIRECPTELTSDFWYTVPKQPEEVKKNEETYWRISFYNHEKYLMKGLNGMKPIIKLMKLLRENRNWKFLSSYAIKTLFLWETEKHSEKMFWKNGIGFLFVYMLKRLSDYAKNNEIPFYWDKKLNLLKTKDDTASNMNNYILRMIKKIDMNLDNPRFILRYFGISCEATNFIQDMELIDDVSKNHLVSSIDEGDNTQSPEISSTSCADNVSEYPSSILLPKLKYKDDKEYHSIISYDIVRSFEKILRNINDLSDRVKDLHAETILMARNIKKLNSNFNSLKKPRRNSF